MIKIDEIKSPPIVGKFYLVPCVQLPDEVRGFNAGEWVPIVGGLHHDQEIGTDELHYHQDWRFSNIEDTSPSEVIGVSYYFGEASFPSPDTEIKYFRKKCRRESDTRFRDYAWEITDQLEQLLENAKMDKLTCPHRGANLASVPIKDGCVVCPLHGLKWSVTTGELECL